MQKPTIHREQRARRPILVIGKMPSNQRLTAGQPEEKRTREGGSGGHRVGDQPIPRVLIVADGPLMPSEPTPDPPGPGPAGEVAGARPVRAGPKVPSAARRIARHPCQK